MQTLKQFFNPIRWRQLAIVFLAGVVLLVSTACGSTQAAVPDKASTAVANPPEADSMYPYKDTQRDTSAADAKADRMIREAEQRIEKGNDMSLGERAGEVGQSAQQAAENIGQSTKRAAENAAENARGMVDGAANAIN